MSATTNKIATRSKPSNRDNFRIPFVIADPSSSTRFYKHWCEHKTANQGTPMVLSAVHTTLPEMAREGNQNQDRRDRAIERSLSSHKKHPGLAPMRDSSCRCHDYLCHGNVKRLSACCGCLVVFLPLRARSHFGSITRIVSANSPNFPEITVPATNLGEGFSPLPRLNKTATAKLSATSSEGSYEEMVIFTRGQPNLAMSAAQCRSPI